MTVHSVQFRSNTLRRWRSNIGQLKAWLSEESLCEPIIPNLQVAYGFNDEPPHTLYIRDMIEFS